MNPFPFSLSRHRLVILLLCGLALGAGLLVAGALWIAHPSGTGAADTPPSTPAAPEPPARMVGLPVRIDEPITQFRMDSNGGTPQAMAPDGATYVAIVNEYNRARGQGTIDTLLLSDATTGRRIRAISGPNEDDEHGFECAVLAPDGKRVLTGNYTGWVRLFDVASGAEVGSWRENFRWIDAVAFAPDGHRFATASSTDQGSSRLIHVYATDGKKKLFTLTGHLDTIIKIVFTSDGKRLVSGSRDQTVRVWDLEKQKEVMKLEGHTQAVLSVAVSADGTRAVSGGYDGRLCLWDLATGKLIRRTRELEDEGGYRGIQNVAFTPNGSRILWTTPTTVCLGDVGSGQLLARFGKRPSGTFLMFPDGTRFLSGWTVWEIPDDIEPVAGVSAPADCDPPSGRVLVLGPEMSGDAPYPISVDALTLVDGGPHAVAGFNQSYSSALVRWDLATGHVVSRVEFKVKPRADGSRGVMAITNDGKLAAAGGWGGKLCLVDALTGEDVRTLVVPPTEMLYKAAFTPNGAYLLACEAPQHNAEKKANIHVWDVRTGELVRDLVGQTDLIWALAVTPDGNRVLSGGGGQSEEEPGKVSKPVRCFLHLWDLQTGKEIRRMEGHEAVIDCVAVSADGKRAITGAQAGAPIVWDLESGQQIRQLNPHLNRNGSYATTAVALSADGKHAATGGADNDIRYYDLEGGSAEVVRFENHKDAVWSLRFMPDGKKLVSGSADGTVRVWELP